MKCRERAVVPTRLDVYETELDYDGRRYSISIPDLLVLKCGNCGSIYLDDEADERISEALRVQAGLLPPDEIRKGREELDLTPKQLASLLRVSEFTLSRWEKGAQIQSHSMDAFLRVFFRSAEARRLLGPPEGDPGVAIPEARHAAHASH